MSEPQTATVATPIETCTPVRSAAHLRWIAVEYAALFYLLPALYVLNIVRLPIIPYLCILAIATTVYLLRRSDFDRTKFWNLRAARQGIIPVVSIFLANAAAISLLVYFLLPERFLSFHRENITLWVIVMIFYPLFSVYPQEIIYRVFMFERYKPLFQNTTAMIVASAAAFAFGHIIFGHWISVVMTLIGGIMFGITYARSKSALLTAFEHALYGDLIFTIGLGTYFYTGGHG